MLQIKVKMVLRKIALILVTLIILAQTSVVASWLVKSADHRAVMSVVHNDAGVAVEVAVKSKLYKDNHWRPYGPVYYRLAHTLSSFVPLHFQSDSRSEIQKTEASHHFYLMFVSLLSLLALSALLAILLTEDILARGILIWAFLSAFLSQEEWVKMIFFAHPDLLFCFLVALATFWSLCWLLQPNESYLAKRTGLAWAIATSTKMTTSLFAPALLLHFWPWKKGITVNLLKTFLLFFFVFYFLVGFPQNFTFWENLQFLAKQKRNVLWGDVEMLKIWLSLFSAQMWPPVAVALSGLILFSPNQIWLRKVSLHLILKLILFVVFPTLFLLSRRVTSAYDYYPLPFIASLLVGMIVIEQILKAQFDLKFPNRQKVPRQIREWTPYLGFILIPCFFQADLPKLEKEFSAQQMCRAEARKVEAVVELFVKADAHILVDPYIPYNQEKYKGQITMTWEMNQNKIQEGKTKLIGIKRDYYEIYLPVEEGGFKGVVDHIKDWDATRNFYRLFHNKENAVDIYQQDWERFYTDDCGFELWRRVSHLPIG
jgi:hypothetical protein